MKAELQEIKTELVRQLRHIGAVVGRQVPEPLRKHSREIGHAVITSLLAIVGTTVLGIYAFGWQNPLSVAVTQLLPLPAGYIAGQPLSYHDYAVRANAILPHGKASNLQAFGELVNNALVYRLAKQARITISATDVERQVTLDMNLRGGEKSALAEIEQTYGLDRNGYSKRVELGLLRLQLEQWLAQSDDNQAVAKVKANQVLDRAKTGTSFDELVRSYSTVVGAGDAAVPGHTGLSGLPVEVRTEVLVTKVGGLVDRPVLAAGSYYVVKRLPDEGEAMVQAIVIRPRNLNEWLADELAAQKPVKLIPQVR